MEPARFVRPFSRRRFAPLAAVPFLFAVVVACSSSTQGNSTSPAPYEPPPPKPTCEASSTDCYSCQCPDTGTWCSVGQGCVPLSGVGGPCVDDQSCKSRNCGQYTKTCRVP